MRPPYILASRVGWLPISKALQPSPLTNLPKRDIGKHGKKKDQTYNILNDFSSSELRELFAEYHLGRGAFRLCKRGTKYCGWDRTMPDFYKWRCETGIQKRILKYHLRHMCLVYDGFKDLYKVFADGEKIDSGSWTGDGVFEPARF